MRSILSLPKEGVIEEETMTDPPTVERSLHGMMQEFSLADEWRYKQTGSELVDYFPVAG